MRAAARSTSQPVAARRAIESPICQAGTTEEGAVIRSIMAVAAVGGKSESPTARPELGCQRMLVSMMNGTKLANVNQTENCCASRMLLVTALMAVIMLPKKT